MERLRDAELVGFSIYVWNVKLSLEIARRLKEECPGTVIVFGGPQVPDRSEEFLRANPFIDIACHGEGEAVFTSLLDRAEARDWDGVPGISLLHDDGTYEVRPKGTRIARHDRDPVAVPRRHVRRRCSTANPDERWVMIWETNRGCPFSCTFCDWGSATQSKVFRFAEERVYARSSGWPRTRSASSSARRELRDAAARRRDHRGGRRRRRTARLSESFSVQNTKNATERAYKIQKLLPIRR